MFTNCLTLCSRGAYDSFVAWACPPRKGADALGRDPCGRLFAMRINVLDCACLLLLACSSVTAQPVDYVRDVKPILRRVVIAVMGRSGRRRAFGSTRRLLIRRGGESGPAIEPGHERREPADRARDRGCESRRPHAAAERGGGARRTRDRHPPRLDRPGSGGSGRGRARRPAPALGLCAAGAAGGALT